jgi:Na+-dependent transporters of the SNF family
MAQARGHFTSRFGFLMAAAGSAVGLGNIWGFPTQAASNGGGAFVLAYLILAFLLAYPALMAELIIGRHSNANIVTALTTLSERPLLRRLGGAVGYYGVLVVSLILSFYSIVAGWMLARAIAPFLELLGFSDAAFWLTESSLSRDLIACFLFSMISIWIVARGVSQGIEAWSTRLMPTLAILLIALIVYVLNQPGAGEGLRVYLLPEFSRVLDPALLLSAMGQAFFSLSLGVGTMLVYGSYLGRALSEKDQQDKLPHIGATLTLLDASFAFVAGLLIVPAMYVAQAQGIAIYGATGELLAGPGLVLQILPTLFDNMGDAGIWVSMAFFVLMVIAALTSSISMLEAPVSVFSEKTGLPRTRITMIVGVVIFLISSTIILNFSQLFDGVVAFTTKYSQPLLGLALCLFAGWVWHRDKKIQEIVTEQGIERRGFFWRIWPTYVRILCPLLIFMTFMQSLRG